MDTQILIISIGGLIIILQLVLWMHFDRKFKKLFGGTQATDLEGTIHTLHKKVEILKDHQNKTFENIDNINSRLAKSVRNIETIRFNPFPDAGGNQSFAIALLDEEGDGVVLSSLYARDRMSVFAKPVEKGAPVHELSSEEEEVLKKVKHKNGKQK